MRESLDGLKVIEWLSARLRMMVVVGSGDINDKETQDWVGERGGTYL